MKKKTYKVTIIPNKIHVVYINAYSPYGAKKEAEKYKDCFKVLKAEEKEDYEE